MSAQPRILVPEDHRPDPSVPAGPASAHVAPVAERRGGRPLTDAMRARRLAPPALLELAWQLAQALAERHRQGHLHLGIEPSRIVVAGTTCHPPSGSPLGGGQPARLADPPAAPDPRGASGVALAYLAPEQTGRTGHPVDARTDLYALGATLYELIVARPPFAHADPLQLLHDVLAQRPVPPSTQAPDTPPPLSDIVMRLLEKDPARRYQSAEGLAHDLALLRGRLAAGDTGTFELGRHDFAARLAAPARLIGREAELAALQAALAQAAQGHVGAVLIAGAPGVGKSRLINALRPLVSARRGWFVGGKFDQYRQDRSTDAVHQVFRALGRLLLAEPEAELAPLRARMRDALGTNAGLIAATNPEFALLLGVAPEPPGADPAIAARRHVRAAVDLICAITSPARPLVVVLDDLQWAAPTPLAWIDTVLADDRAHGLLLVCAYRDAEVDAAHPLTAMQARWQRQPAAPVRLALRNFDSADLAALLGDMLRMAPPDAAALAAAVAPHCGGNPFDTVELVNALRDQGLLVHRGSGWHWDPQALRRHVAPGGVIDLLRARLHRLPPRCRRLLGLMACLGGEVEPALLHIATGLTPVALDRRLAPALDDGLVLAAPGGEGAVRFRHDRVQQAAYASLTAASRRRLHRVLARRLAASTTFSSHAAEQYLPAVTALRDEGERRRAAQLFLDTAAGLRAINLPLAERLLAAGASLLDAAAGGGALRAALQIDHHAALYSLGRLDEADRVYRALEAGASDALRRVDPACVQISSLSNRGRQQEAAALGLGLLAELGFEAPPAVSAADIVHCHQAMAAVAHDDRQRAPARAPAVLSAGKLMNRLMPALHRVDIAAMAWLVTEAMRLWVRHGPCAELMGPIAHACHVHGATAADYRRGYETLRHVLDVGEARGYEPAASQARFLFGLGASHWFEPLEDSLPSLRRAREGLLHGGDLQNACFTYMPLLSVQLDCAPTLGHFSADVEAALAFSERTGNLVAHGTFTGLQRLVAVLQAEPGAPDRLAPWFAEVPAGDAIQNARRHMVRALAAALLGDATALREHTRQATEARHPHHFYAFTQLQLLSALALADEARSAPGDTVGRAGFEACRDWMAERAADAPANFGHLLAWLDAERAWIAGDPWAATQGFDTALREAARRQRPWHAALIAERAARFHFAHGLESTGRALAAEARRRFDAWGASAKVRQLDAAHAFLRGEAGDARPRTAATAPAGADTIDLLAIVRASQALASETSLAKLHARVAALLGEMTGATSVRVPLWRDGEWHDPAAGGALPLSVLRYVQRTREPLVLANAAGDDRFAADPSLRGACSLLAVPILHQGELSALLLLENRAAPAAFGAERLDAVMLITGQLAVSLANVQLYESLEQRVQERTRELERAQARFVTAARMAGMAEIAVNVLHNVGNVLNSVNVSANLIGATLRDSRLDALTRAMSLLDEHAHDLGDFITQDPRGKLVPGFLRDVTQALSGEHVALAEELGVLVKSVDHIKEIVATQQSYAGASRFVETVHIDELLDDAVRMNADALARHQVEVVKALGALPPLALDRHRLLQILVNLISNAKHATAALPGRDARITLGAALASSAAGRVLRITVADNGEGIPEEHLTRVFSHGFTTRSGGHGFGLHSCALAAQEMGGTLSAQSAGRGEGACFVLEVPVDAGAAA